MEKRNKYLVVQLPVLIDDEQEERLIDEVQAAAESVVGEGAKVIAKPMGDKAE